MEQGGCCRPHGSRAKVSARSAPGAQSVNLAIPHRRRDHATGASPSRCHAQGQMRNTEATATRLATLDEADAGSGPEGRTWGCGDLSGRRLSRYPKRDGVCNPIPNVLGQPVSDHFAAMSKHAGRGKRRVCPKGVSR